MDRSDNNTAEQSTTCLLRQDVDEAHTAFAAVGALERLGFATFGNANTFLEEQVSCLLQIRLSTSRPQAPKLVSSISRAPSSLPCPRIGVY